MKKNRMMRLASLMLVAVLMTTCTISGTFAKYVTEATGTDTARVAKWGVTVTAQTEEVFGQKYENTIDASGTKVVSAADEYGETGLDDVLAPGTNGNLGSIAITGTPEVMVDITATADLVLTGWAISGVEYCPLVFTVGTDEFKIGGTYNGNPITTVSELETAVEESFVAALAANDVAANTNLADSITMTWSWPFEVGANADEIAANDAKDTALGNWKMNGAAVPTITFSYSATVTQVD